MIRQAVLLSVLMLAAGPLAARVTPDARPPLRPEVTEDHPATAKPADLFHGPPAPPVWFTMAEPDDQFAACRLALSMLGTVYQTKPAQTDPDDRDCGIARPLKISQIIPGVELTGSPVMRCDTARALALWTDRFLRPASALMDGSPRLTALKTGPAYSCRDRVGTGADLPKQSEHAYGNAIDIMGFAFDDGTELPVQPRSDSGDQSESFQRAARGTACLLFRTVLGPGANAAHDDHLHLDMAARNNGWRLCE